MKVKARLPRVRHSLPPLDFTSVVLAFLLPRFPSTPTSNEPAFCVYKLTVLTRTLVGSPSASPKKDCTVLIPKALERAINVSLPYTRELHSSATMYNHPDTQQILTRLVNDGTPQEIAEEGLRICRVNADLRAEVCCDYTKCM